MPYRGGVRLRVRLITVYLTVYFVLLLGAALTLWRSRVLQRMPPSWLAWSALLAIGLGVVLALISRPAAARAAGAHESGA
jgi:hypothetical protein